MFEQESAVGVGGGEQRGGGADGRQENGGKGLIYGD